MGGVSNLLKMIMDFLDKFHPEASKLSGEWFEEFQSLLGYFGTYVVNMVNELKII